MRRHSGDDPDPEVVPQLFQEDEGQHCVRDQPDPGWNKTLIKRQRTQLGCFSQAMHDSCVLSL